MLKYKYLKSLLSKGVYCGAVALLFVNAAHASIGVEVSEIQQLFKQGDNEKISDLLKDTIDVNVDEEEIVFIYAMALSGLKQYAGAEEAFRALLVRDPSNPRVKLELAVVLIGLNKLDEANNLLAAVKEENIPPVVRGNIERLTTVIETKKAKGGGDTPNTKNWFASVSIGYNHNSNANNATGERIIQMFNVNWALSDDAMQQSDGALSYSLNAGMVHSFDNGQYIRGSVNYNANDYQDLDALDSKTIGGSIGTGSEIMDRLSYYIPFNLSRTTYGHDVEWSNYSYGISPTINYLMDQGITLGTTLNLSEKHYKDDPDKQSSIWNLSSGVKVQMPVDGVAGLTLGHGQTLTENSPTNAYKSSSINFNYAQPLFMDLTLSPYATLTRNDYYGYNNAFASERLDNNTTIGVSLNYVVKQFYDINIVSTFANTNNSSNQALYDYTNKKYSFELRKNF